MKQQNDLDTFPVAYGADIWLDKNKGSGTANYSSLQAMYNDDELGGGGSSIQVETMPTASAENVGKIVQYIGETGSYEHGCFYECKDESGSYVWRYISTVKNGVFYTSDNIIDSTLYPVGSVAVYTGEPLWGLFKGHHYEYVEDTPLTTYKFNGTKNGETLSFFLANKELEVGSALVRISDGYIVSYVSAINGTTITIQGRTYTETFTDVVETGETEEVASYTGWIDIGGGDSGNDYEEFVGTQAEWDALSQSQKNKYDGKIVNILEDGKTSTQEVEELTNYLFTEQALAAFPDITQRFHVYKYGRLIQISCDNLQLNRTLLNSDYFKIADGLPAPVYTVNFTYPTYPDDSVGKNGIATAYVGTGGNVTLRHIGMISDSATYLQGFTVVYLTREV